VRLVGYGRISSASQQDNTSLRDQEERIVKWCDLYGHELVAFHSDVKSGKDTAREGFWKALDLVRSDRVDGLVGTKLDRCFRNTRDLLTCVDEYLLPLSKHLILLDLGVDTSTPTGRMILTMMGAVAELERHTINQRTQGGRRRKAEEGGYAFGSPAYGWKSANGVLVEVPEEQEVLKKMSALRAEGLALAAVAKSLNELGHRSKRGGNWNASQVMRCLNRNQITSEI